MLRSHPLFQATPTNEMFAGAPCYFPIKRGRYEVTPGLIPLGTNLGNDPQDQHLFQIDSTFAHFRSMKEVARQERLEKYYQSYNLSPEVMAAVTQLMVERLTQEHPQFFRLQARSDQGWELTCQHTQEILQFDQIWQLQAASSPSPGYCSSLDALALQIQEDFAIVSRSANGEDWLSAIHVCFPNHWAAEAKIGQNFAITHHPVAGMEPINRQATKLVHTMIARSPAVRFAWGLSTDTRLNHHPMPPPGVHLDCWQGRQFDPNDPKLYLRIERQVIWGLPEQNAALFTIRTYFRDCAVIKQQPEMCQQLIQAIVSMSPASLNYKGLAKTQADILNWLQH